MYSCVGRRGHEEGYICMDFMASTLYGRAGSGQLCVCGKGLFTLIVVCFFRGSGWGSQILLQGYFVPYVQSNL